MENKYCIVSTRSELSLSWHPHCLSKVDKPNRERIQRLRLATRLAADLATTTALARDLDKEYANEPSNVIIKIFFSVFIIALNVS